MTEFSNPTPFPAKEGVDGHSRRIVISCCCSPGMGTGGSCSRCMPRGSCRDRIAAEPEHWVEPARASWAIASSLKRGAGVVGWSEDAFHDRHRAAAYDDAITAQFDADQARS